MQAPLVEWMQFGSWCWEVFSGVEKCHFLWKLKPSVSHHASSFHTCILEQFLKVISETRSLGALRAPTSRWRPFGPLDFVLRALRALRPCDPRKVDQHPPFPPLRLWCMNLWYMNLWYLRPWCMYPWCMYPWCKYHDAHIHEACIHDACIHDAYIHDACIHDACIHQDACIHFISMILGPDVCVCMMYIFMILGPDTYLLTLDPMHVRMMHLW